MQKQQGKWSVWFVGESTDHHYFDHESDANDFATKWATQLDSPVFVSEPPALGDLKRTVCPSGAIR